jgi:hypothetical protein
MRVTTPPHISEPLLTVDGVEATRLPAGIELRHGPAAIAITASSCGRLSVAHTGADRSQRVDVVPAAALYEPRDVLLYSTQLVCLSPGAAGVPMSSLVIDVSPAMVRALRRWLRMLALVARHARLAREDVASALPVGTAPHGDDPFACLLALVVLEGRLPREAGPLVAALTGRPEDGDWQRLFWDDRVQSRLAQAAKAAAELA